VGCAQIGNTQLVCHALVDSSIKYGNTTDTDADAVTQPTQALFLFSTGKKPVEVAIELDVSASEVQNLLEEFWALNDLREMAFVYDEIKTFLPPFLKLFHCLKNNKMMGEKHISNVLIYVGNDLPQLTDRVQCLSNEITNLEGQKRNSMNKVILWNAPLTDLDKAIDIRNQQLKRMGK